MDVAFEMLVPAQTDLSILGLKAVQFEWQGSLYPQGLPQCSFGKHFQLFETPVPKHLISLLPCATEEDGWRCLSVKGDGLDLLSCGEPVQWGGRGLRELLDTVLGKTKRWMVVFEINSDTIDLVLEGDVDDIEPLIVSSLKSEPKGFLMSHDE